MKMRDFVERGIRDALNERHNGYDATRACPAIFECELALRNFLNTEEFSNIVSAWSAAKRGLIYAVSPRSEGILKMVDILNRWAAEGLLDFDSSLSLPFEKGKNNDDNDVA